MRSTTPERRRKFSPEFRDEAVRMVIAGNKPTAQVAKELGINPSTLGHWVATYRKTHLVEEEPFPVPKWAMLRELDVSGATLLWWADPMDPLGIWAVYPQATEPYTLYWGDGTSTPMAASSRPIRHTYATPAQYVLVAFTPITVNAQVVVRGARVDTVFTVDGSGRTVTAHLPVVAEPVLYRIHWGDGVVTMHDATDLSPSHTYAAAFGTPIIAVTDVPARWTIYYTPSITSSVPRTVFQPRTGEWIGAGDIYLHGFPPGVTVTMQLNENGTQRKTEKVVEPDGTSQFAVEFWSQPDEDWWRSARFAWTDPDSGQPRQHTQHIRTCEWTTDVYGRCPDSTNDIPLTFDWDDEQPYVITATAAPIQAGEYDITWGDGQTTHHSVGTEGRLDVTHDYGSNQTAEITISGPSGTGRRIVQPGTIFSIENTKDGPVLWWMVMPLNDAYRPVRIDPGDSRWPPIIESVSPGVDPIERCGTAWTYRDSGSYTCRISAPMTDPFDHIYTQATDRPDLEQSDHDIPASGYWLSWKFRPGTITETSYTAHFDLTNNENKDWMPLWEIHFKLGPGEVLADAGPYRIGHHGDRWIIYGNTRIPALGTITVDIKVDPATNPPVFPRDVETAPASLPLT